MSFVKKCKVLHVKMEVKYFISNSSETIILTSRTLVRIRRSEQKYYSLEVIKNMDFGNEIASNENEFDFELLRKEIDCIHEGIIDRGNESSIGDSDIVLSVRN